MPKSRTRHTCTECSRRRQQCDRQIPCGRCVKRGVAEQCQLDWGDGGYNPTRHRVYPSNQRRPRASVSSRSSAQQEATDQRSKYTFKPFRDAQLHTTTSDGTCSTYRSFVQTLLPSADHIWHLVEYHEQYLLWYHCDYHGPTFRYELGSILNSQSDQTVLQITDLHMQWLALLFAIMAGSATCATKQRLRAWGFSQAETAVLSIQWYKAAVQCLHHGQWTSEHSILSIQAVTSLTMAAPALDQSSELSVLLGAATKIACALGLHKLAHNPQLEEANNDSTDEQRHHMLRRDMGRKLWSQLCVQDWLSLPFTGSLSINPDHFTSTRPSSRSHLTMEHIPQTFPTYISYGNYIFDIAKLVMQHHEASLQATTSFTRYSHVLDYSARMRELATKNIPEYFRVTQPVDALWPEWIHWARSSLTVCFAHKIIMIHRAYIRQSFTNQAYNSTRVTCVAAAKTILNEAKQNETTDGPIIWIDKAFCVTAALILCLDIAHRSRSDADYANHQQLVTGCITQLEALDSIIAVNGAKLISAVLAQHSISLRATPSGHSQDNASDVNLSEVLALIRATDNAPGDTPQGSGEMFPPLSGFSNAYLLENFFPATTADTDSTIRPPG